MSQRRFTVGLNSEQGDQTMKKALQFYIDGKWVAPAKPKTLEVKAAFGGAALHSTQPADNVKQAYY